MWVDPVQKDRVYDRGKFTEAGWHPMLIFGRKQDCFDLISLNLLSATFTNQSVTLLFYSGISDTNGGVSTHNEYMHEGSWRDKIWTKVKKMKKIEEK